MLLFRQNSNLFSHLNSIMKLAFKPRSISLKEVSTFYCILCPLVQFILILLSPATLFSIVYGAGNFIQMSHYGIQLLFCDVLSILTIKHLLHENCVNLAKCQKIDRFQMLTPTPYKPAGFPLFMLQISGLLASSWSPVLWHHSQLLLRPCFLQCLQNSSRGFCSKH